MSSRLHHTLPNLEFFLHIQQYEYIIDGMMVISIPSRAIRRASQNEPYLPFQTFFWVRLVVVHHLPDINVINEPQKSYIFHDSSHCSLSFFAHARRPGRLYSIHDVVLCHIVNNCTGSSFRRVLRPLSFSSVFLKYIIPFLTWKRRFILTFGSGQLAVENSSYQFPYEQSSSGCNSGLITTFPSLTILVTSSYGGRSWAIFGASRTELKT